MKSDSRRSLLPAALATVLFGLCTFWTHYPFLVDDYVFVWKSYLPNFNLLVFDNLLVQRPLASLQSYLWFKFHIFERSKVLFYVYYFFHALGVIGIFHWLISCLGSDRLKRDLFNPGIIAIATVIALYPSWFELTLMALDLPFSFGVFLLALALHSKKGWIRAVLLLLCFESLEAYLFPALGLLLLPELAKYPKTDKKGLFVRCCRVSISWMIAVFAFFIIQSILNKVIHHRNYSMSFNLSQMISSAGVFLNLLCIQQFYKVNWVSTFLEWVTICSVCVVLIHKNFTNLRLIIFSIALPLFGAIHSLLLNSYYAPRAIHGAMVLRVAFIGLLLAEYFVSVRTRLLKIAPVVLIGLAYLGHQALITYSRGINARIIEKKILFIENEIKTCVSPCIIHAEHLGDDLRWDWIMHPIYHEVVVKWIMLRNKIDKKVEIIH